MSNCPSRGQTRTTSLCWSRPRFVWNFYRTMIIRAISRTLGNNCINATFPTVHTKYTGLGLKLQFHVETSRGQPAQAINETRRKKYNFNVLPGAQLIIKQWRSIGSEGIDPLILNSTTICRWVFSFTLRPLCSREESPSAQQVEGKCAYMGLVKSYQQYNVCNLYGFSFVDIYYYAYYHITYFKGKVP